MLIATFGPSSAFVQWCVHALNTLAATALGEFDYISVSTIQDFKTALASRQSKHVLMYTDCPDQGLVDAFQKSQIPFLALDEDPADITGFLMRDRGFTWLQAVRLLSLSFATTAGLFGSPAALRLSRHHRLTMGDFLDQVTLHMGLELQPEQVDSIIQILLPGGDVGSGLEDAILHHLPNAKPIGHRLDIPDADRPVVDMMLASMRYTKDGGVLQEFNWSSGLFVGKDGFDHPLTQPVDMTGPARCIVYGPYLHLPVGLWEVSLTMEIAENFSGNSIDVDIFHGTVLHLETFKLPKSGLLGLTLKFPISESREPVQIRIIMREGAIEGKLWIGDIGIRNITQQALSPA